MNSVGRRKDMCLSGARKYFPFKRTFRQLISLVLNFQELEIIMTERRKEMLAGSGFFDGEGVGVFFIPRSDIE